MNGGTPVNPSTAQLGPDSIGKWLITTQGSQHIWDLDNMTYQRLPGNGRGQFAHDNTTVHITRVDRWPHEGETFFIWFDDPDKPELLEHWRQSSTIVRIEPVTNETTRDDT